MNRYIFVGIAICRYPLGGIRDSKIAWVHTGPSAICRDTLNGYRNCVFCRYRLRRYPGPLKYAGICRYPGSRVLGWDFDVGIHPDLNPGNYSTTTTIVATPKPDLDSSTELRLLLSNHGGRSAHFAFPLARVFLSSCFQRRPWRRRKQTACMFRNRGSHHNAPMACNLSIRRHRRLSVKLFFTQKLDSTGISARSTRVLPWIQLCAQPAARGIYLHSRVHVCQPGYQAEYYQE